MNKEKLKLYVDATKAIWNGFYRTRQGDVPERAYWATKKTTRIVYDLHLRKKVEKVKDFFKGE